MNEIGAYRRRRGLDIMDSRMRRMIGILVILLAAACGDGPTSPTPPPPSAPHFAAGTVVTLVSGETGQPVAGAGAVLAGGSSSGDFLQAYVTDAAGRFQLDRHVLQLPMPQLEVTSANFLPRQTFLRAGEDREFPLWPATSPTGLDETFTSSIVYTSALCPASSNGGRTMQRHPPSSSQVTLVLDSTLQAPEHRARHEQAVELLNQALGGAMRYSVASIAPTNGTSFSARIDAGHTRCSSGDVAAFVSPLLSQTGDEFYIVGGEVTYCAEEYASDLGLVLHELGHTYGLRHSLSGDVMSCPFVGRPTAFTSREALVMRLMRLRRGGNLWPDSDPEYIRTPVGIAASVPIAAPAPTEVIICPR